ncbi:MAG: SDR family oxidoreductase [Pseudomonadales bacterium]|nr:SDR family oxidoreductase [Pseudomonadales bacterium]
MSSIAHQTVVITGAGSGLGCAMAHAFSRQNWSVAVADINIEAGEQVVTEIKAAGGEAFFQPCDVREETDLQQLRERCLNQWQGIGVLINNAGVVSSLGSTELTPMSEWQRLLDINLLGVVRGCAAFTPTFKAQQGGHIVNIASIAGIISLDKFANYNASKAAVIALSETLRIELGKKNIGVTVVCPSLFKTNLPDSMVNPREGQHEKVSQAMARSSLSADDIARKVVNAVRKNQFYLLPHKHTWLVWWLKRSSIGLYEKIISRWPIS